MLNAKDYIGKHEVILIYSVSQK